MAKIDRLAIPVWKLYIKITTFSEIFMVAASIVRPKALFEIHQNLPGAPVHLKKKLYSIFLESRSVLGAKFSSAYNTSKHIKTVKNHSPPNFQYFQKLCITFNKLSMFNYNQEGSRVGGNKHEHIVLNTQVSIMYVAILYSKGHGMKPLQIRAMISQYYTHQLVGNRYEQILKSTSNLSPEYIRDLIHQSDPGWSFPDTSQLLPNKNIQDCRVVYQQNTSSKCSTGPRSYLILKVTR